MPRFDTSFNFGANVAKPKKTGTGKKRKKPKGKSSKSRKHFAAMYGS
jgi:hypothetical protein